MKVKDLAPARGGVTMVAAIGFSAFMALSLTPALCASLLKPVEAGHHHAKTGLFGWFNRNIEKAKSTIAGLSAGHYCEPGD